MTVPWPIRVLKRIVYYQWMNWVNRRDEIQKAFFRTGIFTFLSIDFDEKTGLVQWVFTFLDLGMCHCISSSAMVTSTENGIFTVNEGECVSEQEALVAVFDGRLSCFVEELYDELGVVVSEPIS